MIFGNNHLKALGVNKTFLIRSVVLCLTSLLQDGYLDLCISRQFFCKLSYCYYIYICLGFCLQAAYSYYVHQ